MSEQSDLKKDWETTKKQLAKFSKNMLELAKRSEKEIVKLSHRGKLHLDASAIGLKQEHLYYLIGKEYVSLKNPAMPSDRLKRLVVEYKKVMKEQKQLKEKLK